MNKNRSGRTLQPGDQALSDFNRLGHLELFKILDRKTGTSQSGILFKAHPPMRNHADEYHWIDADWFHAIPEDESS